MVVDVAVLVDVLVLVHVLVAVIGISRLLHKQLVQDSSVHILHSQILH